MTSSHSETVRGISFPFIQAEKKLIEESHKEMEKMLLVGTILYYIAKAKFT